MPCLWELGNYLFVNCMNKIESKKIAINEESVTYAEKRLYGASTMSTIQNDLILVICIQLKRNKKSNLKTFESRI